MRHIARCLDQNPRRIWDFGEHAVARKLAQRDADSLGLSEEQVHFFGRGLLGGGFGRATPRLAPHDRFALGLGVMPSPDWNLVLAEAEAAARAAAPAILAAARDGIPFEWKPDNSPVTQADRAAEVVIRERLEPAFPEYGWLGEETGSAREHARFCWVVDPIDGTKSFIGGLPLYGTLIGLADGGKPVAGVMYLPASDEAHSAAPGLGYRINGRLASPKPAPRQQDTIAVLGNPLSLEEQAPGATARLRDAFGFLLYGGGCPAIASLCRGRAHVLVESGLSSYDFVATAPLLEHAGGIISDWHGLPLTIDSGLDGKSDTAKGTLLAASTARLHDLARTLIHGA